MKLTPDKVREIESILSVERSRGRTRWPQVYVAALYGINQSRVSQIKAAMTRKKRKQGE